MKILGLYEVDQVAGALFIVDGPFPKFEDLVFPDNTPPADQQMKYVLPPEVKLTTLALIPSETGAGYGQVPGLPVGGFFPLPFGRF